MKRLPRQTQMESAGLGAPTFSALLDSIARGSNGSNADVNDSNAGSNGFDV